VARVATCEKEALLCYGFVKFLRRAVMTLSRTLLVRLRQSRGWSQEKLAAISGLSERTIQRVERDGTCSLETRLALAAAFNMQATELTGEPEPVGQQAAVVDWGGVVGLFMLGVLTMMVLLVTGPQGYWDVYCAVFILGFGLVISLINHGVRASARLLRSTSWMVKRAPGVSDLPERIFQAGTMIGSVYTAGILLTLVAGLSFALYSPVLRIDPEKFVMLVVRPVIYGVVFAELWFRPYKKKMESMLVSLP
jgi:transcriptional regulator with XRE-family HTH domain